MSKCSSDNSNTEISNIKTVNLWFIICGKRKRVYSCVLLQYFWMNNIWKLWNSLTDFMNVNWPDIENLWLKNSHRELSVGSAKASNQLVSSSVRRRDFSWPAGIRTFIKTKLREKNLFKHVKENENWQNYRFFCFHIIDYVLNFSSWLCVP